MIELLLATVNGKGVSADKGTLEVVALVLVIVLLLIVIFRWVRRR